MKSAGQVPLFHWPARALPRIRNAGRFPMGDNSRGLVYRAHSHAFHLHDYRATFWLGPRRIELQPGDVTVTPAGIESHYDVPVNGFHLCIHFNTTRASREEVTFPVLWHAGAHATFVSARMRHIIELYRQAGDPGDRARVAACAALQALFAWLAFAAAQPAGPPAMRRSSASLERLVQILDERFCEPLPVPELAGEVGVSQNYLAHLFHERMGVTVQQYVASRRIELARHLLAVTRLSIKEIGAQTGWPDPQHFNKQFRRLTGLSPSAARALQ